MYLLECRICGLQDVGETDQVLHQRVNGRRGDITNTRLDNKPFSQHFCGVGHDRGEVKVLVMEVVVKRGTVITILGRSTSLDG